MNTSNLFLLAKTYMAFAVTLGGVPLGLQRQGKDCRMMQIVTKKLEFSSKIETVGFWNLYRAAPKTVDGR
jgi:hypothetical protein